MKNGVKNIQAAAYNGTRTVNATSNYRFNHQMMFRVPESWESKNKT